MFIVCSLNAQVVINEISYNPCGAQGNDGDCEFIEIYNSGAAAVDLSGWSIDDPVFMFPAGTMIAPGEYILITEDGAFGSCAWTSAVPAGVQTFTWTSGNLGNTGESITLSDGDGNAQNMFTYVDGTCGADGDCNSLQYNGTGDNSDCTNWFAGDPNPGAANEEPTFDCPTEMANFGDPCDDTDATTENDIIQMDCSCAGTTITFDCTATMQNFGDACDDGDAMTVNDVVQADCSCAGSVPGDCPAAFINEFHYDNGGADTNEFIEIAVPAGADATQLTITLYASTGAMYNSFTLTSAEFVSSDGTYDYYAWYPTSIQNGGADGFSLSCSDGSVLQLLSYEGTLTATDGPASGQTSTDVGVAEDGGTTSTQSIMFDGAAWLTMCIADPGAANDTSTCGTTAMTGCTDMNACNYDATATEDDGSCFIVGDTCDDMDATTENDVYTDCMTCAGTAIGCPDGAVPGDPCDDSDPATENDVVQADCSCAGTVPTVCPTSAKINEFHYDNAGTDVNEFIEIALPVGSDPSGVVVTLYNGNGGVEYGTYTLTAADLVSSDGTNDYYVWNTSMQNGDDGIAVSCDGTVFQFITYEGAFDATDGPAAGMTGVDVGVEELNDAAETSSIMCDGTGTYLTNCTQDPGMANNTASCVADPIPGCTDMNACNYDATATEDDGSCFNIGDSCDDMDATTTNDVYTDCMTCAGTLPETGCTDMAACNYNPVATQDDGSCIFATGCDLCDGAGGITDNPEVGEACDDGNAATVNDTVQGDCSCLGTAPTCPTTAKINEFHYDNAGTDVNEFIEIALPVGSDPSGVVVTLYNGNGGVEYGTYILTAADLVSSDGTNDYYVWNVSMQNGDDGIAVSCGGTVFQFITYEGAFDATDGPAAGMTGVDVGVDEATDAAETSSIMCDGAGTYLTNCTQDPGMVNDLTSCMSSEVLGCTNVDASNYDPNANTDDGSCLYLCDDPNSLDVSTNGGFDGGTGLSYGLPGGMGLLAGANDDFGGFVWNTNTTGLSANEICISIDFEVTGDAAGFPVTLEFRIENNDCGFFPCPWNDFNMVINGPGTYTFGGVASAGNVGMSGPFDPAGANPAVVAAITNFSGTPLGADIDVVFSNLCITNCVAGCTDANACNYDATATLDDGSCYSVNDTCDDGDAGTENDIWVDCNTCQGTVIGVAGCTDANATNYNSSADIEDGSCLYLCDDTGLLDVSTGTGFDGGTGLSYGSPSGMGLFAGANNDFGGFLWNVNTTGLTNDDFCINIDMEVTGGTAADFPMTLDFRIENNCPTFPCPWLDFNLTITGPGTYTLGGLVSSGTVGASGPFDPAGMNPAIVAAIANFSGTPISADVNVVFSNLCVSTDCVAGVSGCTDNTACNFNPDATSDDGSCIYATGCDVCDGMGGVTDNPDAGEPCDDGNAETVNDVIQADCSCAGVILPPDCEPSIIQFPANPDGN